MIKLCSNVTVHGIMITLQGRTEHPIPDETCKFFCLNKNFRSIHFKRIHYIVLQWELLLFISLENSYNQRESRLHCSHPCFNFNMITDNHTIQLLFTIYI